MSEARPHWLLDQHWKCPLSSVKWKTCSKSFKKIFNFKSLFSLPCADQTKPKRERNMSNHDSGTGLPWRHANCLDSRNDSVDGEEWIELGSVLVVEGVRFASGLG